RRSSPSASKSGDQGWFFPGRNASRFVYAAGRFLCAKWLLLQESTTPHDVVNAMQATQPFHI
ncbi:MAG: hypothetical protein WB573_10195, partial [Terracidiphilus sp.]